MQSNNWKQMEAAIGAGNWEEAAKLLNSLAMTEMMPALYKLNLVTRRTLVDQASQYFNGLGWTGCANRIRWADARVDEAQGMPPQRPVDLPMDLPPDQVQEARRFVDEKKPKTGSSSLAPLLQAFKDGRLIFNHPTDVASFPKICAGTQTDAVTGLPVHYAVELVRLLNGLLSGGQVQVLSMYRPTELKNGNAHGQGPHSEIQKTAVVVRGVDVAWYGGSQYLYTVPKDQLIEGVKRLLIDLPTGQYDVGFVRPVGGQNGYAGYPGPYDPKLELFFPVPPARVAAAFNPNESWGWSTMFEELRSDMRLAAAGKANYVYPDGHNHVHLRAF
jgi:hypothetical protein